MVLAHSTSIRISRLFLYGPAKGGIGKMRSIFFQRTKSSGGANTMPPGLREKIEQSGCIYLLAFLNYYSTVL